MSVEGLPQSWTIRHDRPTYFYGAGHYVEGPYTPAVVVIEAAPVLSLLTRLLARYGERQPTLGPNADAVCEAEALRAALDARREGDHHAD